MQQDMQPAPIAEKTYGRLPLTLVPLCGNVLAATAAAQQLHLLRTKLRSMRVRSTLDESATFVVVQSLQFGDGKLSLQSSCSIENEYVHLQARFSQLHS